MVSDEILDVPLEREVEFAVDLVPGTRCFYGTIQEVGVRISRTEGAVRRFTGKENCETKYVALKRFNMVSKEKDDSMRLCVNQ